MDNQWIECNLPYGAVYSEDYKTEKDSFSKRELNNPGTLIETKYGKSLIGHMNKNLGICDDCMNFSPSTIVIRYKIIPFE
jgi:hypothetical protein